MRQRGCGKPWLVFTVFVVGCASSSAENEWELRARLQAAHDASLSVEFRASIDNDTLSRNVQEVSMWWGESGPAVWGCVDESGVLIVKLPAIEARESREDPVLHVVDRNGDHWYAPIDLAQAPPVGTYGVQGLKLKREPTSPRVVDARQRPIGGARLSVQRAFPTRPFETVTGVSGRAELCRGVPLEQDAPLIVRHEGFTPKHGWLDEDVELDSGGSIRGRVNVPPQADASDFGVWLSSAERAVPLEGDGSFALCNVPIGLCRIQLVHRDSLMACSSLIPVEVRSGHATQQDILNVLPYARKRAMRLQLKDQRGRDVFGTSAIVRAADVGVECPMDRGVVIWSARDDEPFDVQVRGYKGMHWGVHHDGETLVMVGGIDVRLRLSMDTVRRMLPACRLVASVHSVDPVEFRAGDPIAYVNETSLADITVLDIARDAHLVVAPGSYRVSLRLLRWVEQSRRFLPVEVDVEPREFIVGSEDERVMVTVSTGFRASGVSLDPGMSRGLLERAPHRRPSL